MKKIGLLGLSDPVQKEKVNTIYTILSKEYDVTVSDIVSVSSSGIERACVFNDWMRSNQFDYIMDISGGDLANGTLEYLDYEAFKKSKSLFYGYSDISVVLNALYTKTEKPSSLFQIRNHPILNDSIYDFDYEWICKGSMSGIVIGGNIRCFLKLAGTTYLPSFKDKILFLEAYSGNENRIRTYFSQLEQMHVFQEISGLALGQFTQLDSNQEDGILEEIVSKYSIPVIRTHQIGHSKGSKAIWIGKKYEFDDKEDVCQK